MTTHCCGSFIHAARRRGLFLAGLLAIAVVSGAPLAAAADQPPAPFDARMPFLKEHCLGCHNNKTKKGGLDLENLSADWSVPKTFEAWVKVHDKVHAGEMPPSPRKSPPEKERDAFLLGLRTDLVNADVRRKEKEGRSVLRRLTAQ